MRKKDGVRLGLPMRKRDIQTGCIRRTDSQKLRNIEVWNEWIYEEIREIKYKNEQSNNEIRELVEETHEVIKEQYGIVRNAINLIRKDPPPVEHIKRKLEQIMGVITLMQRNIAMGKLMK
jgi:hypothetical protein